MCLNGAHKTAVSAQSTAFRTRPSSLENVWLRMHRNIEKAWIKLSSVLFFQFPISNFQGSRALRSRTAVLDQDLDHDCMAGMHLTHILSGLLGRSAQTDFGFHQPTDANLI